MAPAQKRLTCKAMAVLCSISLIDCINATMLNPYVDEFVAHLLNKRRGDPGISIWVSVMVGSYSLCEVLFSPMWGMLAERFGRRPILLLGLAGSAVAPVLFGLANSYPAALAARLIDGFFCGNACVARTYLGELVDAENEARAFGLLGVVFSLGLFVGPILGGTLAHPADWAPGWFDSTIFEGHPFFLSNLIFACLVACIFLLGVVALTETRGPREREESFLASAAEASQAREPNSVGSRRLWHLLTLSSILYGYVAARLNSFVLVSSLPRTMHGLDVSPHQFAYIQTFAALMLALNQVTIYPCLVKRCGAHTSCAIGLLWTIVLTLPVPLLFMTADVEQAVAWRLVPITIWQGLNQLGFGTAFPLIAVLLNKECTRRNRSVVNGWSNSLNALSRGLGPVLAGALMHLGCSLESGELRLGRYLAFYVNLLPASVGTYLVFRQRPAASLQTVSDTPPASAQGGAAGSESACELRDQQ
ncbi:ZIFL2 [Symbiodinium microadriaticum]|nr:ZIFL2 [Symbiodinium microadriaticum]